MEIEEKDVDTDRCGGRALYGKHYSIDLYIMNCRPKALKRDGSN